MNALIKNLKPTYLVVLLLTGYSLSGQPFPECVIKPATYDHPQDILRLDDGTYLVASEADPGQPDIIDTVYLEKFDASRQLEWSSKIAKHQPIHLRVHAFAEVYLVTGKEIFYQQGIDVRPFFLLFSDTGELLEEKSYDLGNYYDTDIATNTITRGGFALISVRDELIRIDALGNEERVFSFEETMGYPGDPIRYFYQDQEDNWIILTTSLNLIRLDSEFSFLGETSLAYELFGLTINRIHHDENDDRLLFVGDISYPPNQNEYWHSKAFSSLGEELWSRDYDDIPFTRNGNLYSIIDATNGYYLFGNTVKVENFTRRFYPMIIKLDEQGREEWYYEFPFSSFQYSAMDIVKEMDRFEFTITGHYKCDEDYSYDIYLSNVNIPSEIIVENEGVSLLNNLRIFPNPTGGTVAIHCESAPLSSITIFDTRGKFVRQVAINNGSTTVQVDLSGLPDQLYFLKIVMDGRETVVRKVVKSRY